ncbi:MAG TPA: hypothetical protein P5193_08025 [Microthrixaceae bacterium]|nr:hypothetical protein [Microthrixaceae bacterium]MCB9401925.1 hypothetical protein [Microthrixaceae bacterium]HPG15799.1 hypothetical protein [Microthrixaceae bacterium]HRW41479.1 hypothetical protein [Microthrixaceae bacterium]
MDHGGIAFEPSPDEVLRRGDPTRAVVVHARSSGLRDDQGRELFTLVLNVREGVGSVQLTAVVALDETETDLVAEGADLPVAVLANRGRIVAVDLTRARQERESESD